MIAYILDRNVISTIKNYNFQKPVSTNELRALRKIDKRKYLISPILSIMEGQSGIKEDDSKVLATLRKETEAVARFFKKARTDSDVLQHLSGKAATAFSSRTLENWDGYSRLIEFAQTHLFQPISPRKRWDMLTELIKAAKMNNVSMGHPTLMCPISTLYGCGASHKILKPKAKRNEKKQNRAVYNTVCDLVAINWIATFRAASQEAGHQDTYKFMTFDKGLKFFLNTISTASESGFSTDIIISTTYPKQLFPEMTDEEYASMFELLHSEASPSQQQLNASIQQHPLV